MKFNKIIVLTADEANCLVAGILATQQFRSQQEIICGALSKRKNACGELMFPSQDANKKYWEAMNKGLEVIRQKIEDAALEIEGGFDDE